MDLANIGVSFIEFHKTGDWNNYWSGAGGLAGLGQSTLERAYVGGTTTSRVLGSASGGLGIVTGGVQLEKAWHEGGNPGDWIGGFTGVIGGTYTTAGLAFQNAALGARGTAIGVLGTAASDWLVDWLCLE